MSRKLNKAFKVFAIAAAPVLLVAAAVSAPADGRDNDTPIPVMAPPAPPAPPAPAAMPPAPPAPPHPHDNRGSRRHREKFDEKRAWLGIMLSDDGNGVRISSVSEDSPAEEAGLRRGDVIREINGERVNRSRDLMREMRRLEPGERVDMLVDRDGRDKTIDVTLGEHPVVRHRVQVIGEDDDDGSFEILTPDSDRHIEIIGDGGRGNVFFVGDRGPFLGVEVLSMSEPLRKHFNAPDDQGLMINRVVEDSAAEEAGLEAGDIILEVDGRSIRRTGDIRRALRDFEAGDTVPVTIIRDGTERTIDVIIKEPRQRQGYSSFWTNEPGEGFNFQFDPDVNFSFDFDPDDELMWIAPGYDGTSELTEEQRQEIREQLDKAREAFREAMEGLKLEMREQRETIRNQKREAKEQIRRELMDLKRRLEEQSATRTSVKYDI